MNEIDELEELAKFLDIQVKKWKRYFGPSRRSVRRQTWGRIGSEIIFRLVIYKERL